MRSPTNRGRPVAPISNVPATIASRPWGGLTSTAAATAQTTTVDHPAPSAQHAAPGTPTASRSRPPAGRRCARPARRTAARSRRQPTTISARHPTIARHGDGERHVERALRGPSQRDDDLAVGRGDPPTVEATIDQLGRTERSGLGRRRPRG